MSDRCPLLKVIGREPDSIPMHIAQAAHTQYSKHHSQSLARIIERGGFGGSEVAELLYERIVELEAKNRTLREENATLSEMVSAAIIANTERKGGG